MSQLIRQILIFLAAPSDVRSELAVARRVVEEWNSGIGEAAGAKAEIVHWTTHAHPEAGGDPQEIIDRQLLDRCDVLIGIFWTRFGTPVRRGLSGTEHEIRRSIRSRRPVALYFSDRPAPPSTFNSRQLKRIQTFRREFTKGIYWPYKSVSEFERLLRRHLPKILAAFLPNPLLRVSVGIVFKGTKVLMVKRRIPAGTLVWQFPAGVTKPEEQGAEAVLEEIQDETGVRCRVVTKLGSRLHPVTQIFMEYYECEYLGGRATNLDQRENATVRWVEAREVEGLVTSGLFGPVKKLLRKYL